MSLIHLLAEYPSVQSKVQNEIDDMIGQRDPHVTDRNNCPYTEALIIEALRFIAHAPLAIPHYTLETCNIRGHTIDKGTTVRFNAFNCFPKCVTLYYATMNAICTVRVFFPRVKTVKVSTY